MVKLLKLSTWEFIVFSLFLCYIWHFHEKYFKISGVSPKLTPKRLYKFPSRSLKKYFPLIRKSFKWNFWGFRQRQGQEKLEGHALIPRASEMSPGSKEISSWIWPVVKKTKSVRDPLDSEELLASQWGNSARPLPSTTTPKSTKKRLTRTFFFINTST